MLCYSHSGKMCVRELASYLLIVFLILVGEARIRRTHGAHLIRQTAACRDCSDLSSSAAKDGGQAKATNSNLKRVPFHLGVEALPVALVILG